MDFRYLRFFVAVAEESSFTRAAERLHTVQPSLSNQIKRLEEIVGTQLFTRDRHQTHLTAAGKAFLEYSYRLLDNLERGMEAARAAARAKEGCLTIGYIPGSELVILPDTLPALHEQFPNMIFRLVTGHPQQLFDGLINRVLDFAFGPRIEDPTIFSKVVRRLPLVAAIPANHQLAELECIPIAEFAKYPFVAPAATKLLPAWKVINSLATRAGVTFRQVAEVDNALATVNAVQSGLGVAIIPEHIIPIMPSDVLIRRLGVEPEPYVEHCLSYRQDSTLPRDVLELMLRCFSDKL